MVVPEVFVYLVEQRLVTQECQEQRQLTTPTSTFPPCYPRDCALAQQHVLLRRRVQETPLALALQALATLKLARKRTVSHANVQPLWRLALR
jgi:hypothetical protein